MKTILLFSLLFVYVKVFAISAPNCKQASEPATFADVYKNLNPTIFYKNQDSSAVKAYFSEQAKILRGLAETKYHDNFSSLDDQSIVLAGMVIAGIEEKEKNETNGTAKSQQAATFSCLMSAVGAVAGLGGLANTIAGATMATVFGVVRAIFGIYFSAFTVGWAVYEFGDCMGWW